MKRSIPAVRPEDEDFILDRTQRKIKNDKSVKATGVLLKNVRLLFRMVRDRSFDMSWATRGAILGALLYFIMPIDATPDFIPVLGYVDDAAILGLVIRKLADEILRYKEHAAWR